MNPHETKKAGGVQKPGSFDLGTWLGKRQAFGMIAGICSAAEAESLRKIRDEKLYKTRCLNWDEFCSEHLGASRSNIDRYIRLLEEFGPTYFQVAQLTRISPEAYRAIAGSVGEDGIAFRGEKIKLLPENSKRIAEAVGELRRESRPAGPKPAAEPVKPVDAYRRRINDLARELNASIADAPSNEDKIELDAVVKYASELFAFVWLRLT